MQHVSGRTPGASVVREVRGNVIWLDYPARDHKRSTDPVASLKQSVAILSREIERSGTLGSEIAAAVEAGRYELCKISTTHADRSLARVQRSHLGSLLRFVRAIAATGSGDGARASQPASQLDSLTKSIRELQASLARARRLSRDLMSLSRQR